MSEPTDHHFVPVFYLRGWCANDGRLHVFSRPHDRVVSSRLGPAHTGFERGLYSLRETPTADRQVIEKFLAVRVDTPAAEVLKRIKSAGLSALSPSDWERWAVFMLSLRARSPEAMEDLCATVPGAFREDLDSDPALRAEYDRRKRADDPELPSQWVARNMPGRMEDGGQFLLPKIIGNAAYVRRLAGASWRVFDVSESNVGLLTSDRPLVLRGSLMGDFRVFVPLDPSTALVATNDADALRKIGGHTPNRLSRALNLDTVRQASKRVYASHGGHLHFVARHFPQTPVKLFSMDT